MAARALLQLARRKPGLAMLHTYLKLLRREPVARNTQRANGRIHPGRAATRCGDRKE